jgi:hypothetical protein
MNAMRTFLDDFDDGLRQGRYVADELPSLSFDNGTFDLALCSHFLFLYTDQLTEDFHFHAIRELSRVAREVRVFPLVALGGKPSSYVETVGTRLKESHLCVTIQRVPYEFVRGANELMCVRPNSGEHIRL